MSQTNNIMLKGIAATLNGLGATLVFSYDMVMAGPKATYRLFTKKRSKPKAVTAPKSGDSLPGSDLGIETPGPAPVDPLADPRPSKADLNRMTKAQLMELGKETGVILLQKMTKDAMVRVLVNHKA